MNPTDVDGSILASIADTIKDKVLSSILEYKKTIFLCGSADTDAKSIRPAIRKDLTTSWYKYQYDIFCPEDLFEELLAGPVHHDLLSLENELADSVDAVILPLEGPGTFAELGAFSNNDKLRRKLICLVDEAYRREKSFLNYGPLRLLRDRKEGRILFFDFDKITDKIELIRSAISEISKTFLKRVDVSNIIQAHHFILPAIYLLETASFEDLVRLVGHASKADDVKARALTRVALSILEKQRLITLSAEGYSLTESGLRNFINFGKKGTTRTSYSMSTLDDLRIEVVNWRCRRNTVRK